MEPPDQTDVKTAIASMPDTDILDARQFLSTDVCSVVGINAKQLEHVVDPKRDIVQLTVHQDTRTHGKRRLFSGNDVLKIATVFAINGIGFPQRWAYQISEEVARRAGNRLVGLDLSPNLILACYPIQDGKDWARVPIYDGMKEEPKLPIAVQFIQIDRLIDETLAKLRAVIAEAPLPDFKIPNPEVEPSPYSPENDFFLAWKKNENGKNVRVGLTLKETAWYEGYLARKLEGKATPKEGKKYLELHQKHELARAIRMNDTFAERLNAKLNKGTK